MEMFSATALAAEIDEIARFDGPKKLAARTGLVPTVLQSGGKKYDGRIKKTGRRARSAG